MKSPRGLTIIIISLLCLLFGFGMGWHIKERRDRYVTSDEMKVMLEATETHEQLDALRAIQVIELINANNAQTAVQRLSEPILEYYFVYGSDAGAKDARRAKMRTTIEQLVSTNKIVADELAKQKDKLETRGQRID